MVKIAVWEFEGEAGFDGRCTFAEVAPRPDRVLRAGTLEFCVTPWGTAAGVLLASGAPERDPGSFRIALEDGGAVTLGCSTGGVAPYRMATPEHFAEPGETVQLTLSWGERSRFTAVNLTRLEVDPETHLAGFAADLPLRARIRVVPGGLLTFGAAPGGEAPFFAGQIDRVTLSDSANAPAVVPPSASILSFEAHRRAPVAPRRVAAGTADRADRPQRPTGALDGVTGARMIVSTSEGEQPIESLQPGDEVLTRDHGLRPLRRIETVALDWSALRRRPALRPMVIRRGALGEGLPEADLVLPPEHRVGVIENGRLTLVPARSLTGRRGIFAADALGVRYAHLVFERTETILANGVWLEAFNPADALADGQHAAQRHELSALFPDGPRALRSAPGERGGGAPEFQDADG